MDEIFAFAKVKEAVSRLVPLALYDARAVGTSLKMFAFAFLTVRSTYDAGRRLRKLCHGQSFHPSKTDFIAKRFHPPQVDFVIIIYHNGKL